MKYLQEIAVLALVVIAAVNVYEAVERAHRRCHKHKHAEVKIQRDWRGGLFE